MGLLLNSLHRSGSNILVNVVTPKKSLSAINEELQRSNYIDYCKIIPEEDVIPEARHFPKLGGWQRQQLIKLAMAERLSAPFILMLDADVVCTKEFQCSDLLQGGKSHCVIDKRNLFPKWYSDARAVLRVTPAREGIFHQVTPVVLSRAGILELIAHLDRQWKAMRFPTGRRALNIWKAKLRHRRDTNEEFRAWRLYLCAAAPWTEYSLYFTFLEQRNLFDRFHFEAAQGIYDFKHSIFLKSDFTLDAWQPKAAFGGKGPPYFMILQSTATDTGEVQKKVSDALASWNV